MPVSMNLFCFKPVIFDYISNNIGEFFKNNDDLLTSEYLIPNVAFESSKDMAMNFIKQENGIYKYELEIQPETSGRQDYVLRILPFNANIPHPFTPLFVRWEM